MNSYKDTVQLLQKHEHLYEKEGQNKISDSYFLELKLFVEKWPTHLSIDPVFFERYLKSWNKE